MTNAEKLAKDTDFMVDALMTFECGRRECFSCPIYDGRCMAYNEEDLKNWLESEVKDDE